MPIRRARAALAPAALAALVGLAGCAGTAPAEAGGDAGDTSASTSASSSAEGSAPATSAPAGTALTVDVAGGTATGDTGRVPVALGEQVTLTVTSDAPDELHLHGYDLTAAVGPDAPVTLTFRADIPGVFECELHEAGTVLLSLQVG
ncbi:hypothetical protein [Blastococcus sp. SYSU D00820]